MYTEILISSSQSASFCLLSCAANLGVPTERRSLIPIIRRTIRDRLQGLSDQLVQDGDFIQGQARDFEFRLRRHG